MSRNRKIKWRIRNVLKDGTILQPGERLPVTEASLEAFRQYGEVALKALSQGRPPVGPRPHEPYLP